MLHSLQPDDLLSSPPSATISSQMSAGVGARTGVCGCESEWGREWVGESQIQRLRENSTAKNKNFNKTRHLPSNEVFRKPEEWVMRPYIWRRGLCLWVVTRAIQPVYRWPRAGIFSDSAPRCRNATGPIIAQQLPSKGERGAADM